MVRAVLCRYRGENSPAPRTTHSAARSLRCSPAVSPPCPAPLQASLPRAKLLFPRRKPQQPSQGCGHTTPASGGFRPSARPAPKARLRRRSRRSAHPLAHKEASASACLHNSPAETAPDISCRSTDGFRPRPSIERAPHRARKFSPAHLGCI